MAANTVRITALKFQSDTAWNTGTVWLVGTNRSAESVHNAGRSVVVPITVGYWDLRR